MKPAYARTILGLLWNSECAENALLRRFTASCPQGTRAKMHVTLSGLEAREFVRSFLRPLSLGEYVISELWYTLTPRGRRLVSQGNLTDPPSPSSLVG